MVGSGRCDWNLNEAKPLRGRDRCGYKPQATGFGMKRLIRTGLQHAAENTAGTTSVVRKVVDAYNVEVLSR